MGSWREVTILESCGGHAPRHLQLAVAMAGKLAAAQGARVVALPPVGLDDPVGAQCQERGARASTDRFLSPGKYVLRPSSQAEAERAIEILIARGLAAAVLTESDPARAWLKDAGIAVVELATWPRQASARFADAPTNEFGVMATSGILDLLGDPARAPLRLPGHQVAYAAGLSAFTALMAAIAQRDLDGQPLNARVSLLETAIWINWKAILGAAGEGRLPTRLGAQADFQVMPCVDGWVAFVYTATQFDRVLALLGDAAPSDPRFRDPAWRSANLATFTTTVAPWFAARTREEIYAEGRAHGVPLGPVYTPAELLEDEQYQARHFFGEDGSGSAMRTPRLPVTWNGRRLDPGSGTELTLDDLEAAA